MGEISTALSCRDIYKAALALLGEFETLTDPTDYASRAPYLLTAFCREKSELDKCYREANGIDEGEGIASIWLSLDDDFPLCEVFTGAAAHYLSAMLVSCEDPDLSRELYAHSCESIDGIRGACSRVLKIKRVI